MPAGLLTQLTAENEALRERAERAEAALRQIADYGHEMDDYELPPKRARQIARAALGETA